MLNNFSMAESLTECIFKKIEDEIKSYKNTHFNIIFLKNNSYDNLNNLQRNVIYSCAKY